MPAHALDMASTDPVFEEALAALKKSLLEDEGLNGFQLSGSNSGYNSDALTESWNANALIEISDTDDSWSAVVERVTSQLPLLLRALRGRSRRYPAQSLRALLCVEPESWHRSIGVPSSSSGPQQPRWSKQLVS